VRTTAASRSLADYVSDEDATTVARALQAGAVLLGKLNLTEFAFGVGDPFLFGEPRNPWNLDRSPGTSSAGSAIAVAASLCAFSLGEDSGGSIRGPASATGIVGVRPTWGLVSRHGMLPLAWSMDAAGPMTCTVEDAALVLQVIAGFDPRDPLTRRRAVPDYLASLRDGVRGLHIGLVTELTDEAHVDPEVQQAVQAVADLLAGLGARVERVSLPLLKGIGVAGGLLLASDGVDALWEKLTCQPADLGRGLRAQLMAAALTPAQAVEKALLLRDLFRREWLDLFQKHDLLMSPTSGTAAEPHVYDTEITSREEAEQRVIWHTSATIAAALAGTPAMSVPCGFTSEGLPIGLQIMAGRFREDLMLRAAHAYEQATTWHRQRPPL
jgi:aspartyl-tRNA(Asn)/glutamyl-tRNA(Gln) amidotransferase subunit A